MKKIDERDTMFSRMNYAEGEFPYEDYYSRNPDKLEVDKEIATERLKGLATLYGASLVGALKMKGYHYYSHRRRHKKVYGEEVTNMLPYGLVFAVEMAY